MIASLFLTALFLVALAIVFAVRCKARDLQEFADRHRPHDRAAE